MILEFDDWLDGIHKTAVNSVQNKEIKGGETSLSYHHVLLLSIHCLSSLEKHHPVCLRLHLAIYCFSSVEKHHPAYFRCHCSIHCLSSQAK